VIKTFLIVIFWRYYDFIIKLIWPYITLRMRGFLFSVIDQKSFIHVCVNKLIACETGAIIQVGSNDGISNDPLRPFIETTKSYVYLIEPLPFLTKKLFELYKDNEKIKILEMAIHPEKDLEIFYHLNRDSAAEMGDKWKPWYDQIGSFSKDHLLKHASQVEPHIKELEIKCVTLDKILSDEKISEVMILHVDAEGFDLEVLRSMSIETVKPRMIMFEHKHLTIFKLVLFLRRMKKVGYTFNILHDDVICIHASVEI
jgi:FkbM family methyltransferase